MKRILSLFLALLLTFSATSAFAEGFVLRSGITFGDTMEDILAKEKTLTRKDETSNEFKGSIAGFDDAYCNFRFDDDNKLKSMKYYFGDEINTSQSDANSTYKTLKESLVRKYGSPVGNTGGTLELIYGPAVEDFALLMAVAAYVDGYKVDYIDYDEWIVKCDDYNVKIDLMSYYWRDDDYKYSYTVALSYHMYTDAEYDAKLQEKRNEREAVDNDL